MADELYEMQCGVTNISNNTSLSTSTKLYKVYGA
jgi:hypothetical protein